MKIARQSWDRENNYLGPLCKLDQIVYYPTWNDIVIPVKIVEVIDIHDWNDLGCLWVYRSETENWAHYPTDKMNNEGWPILKQVNDSNELNDLLKDRPIRNQMFWIDEPIGHELTIGCEVFLTINEALTQVRPSKKKNLKKRLNNFRNRMSGFIKHTWKISVGDEKLPPFPKYEYKKVYVRKG